MKLVGDRPTDRPTDQPTDIVLYRAAIAAKKLTDKILPMGVWEVVPECQAYMDLLAFERKLDSTIIRKRLNIQEALKR